MAPTPLLDSTTMTERRAPTTRPRGDFGVRGMEGQWWCAGKVLREVANGWSSMQQLKAWWLGFFLCVCLLKIFRIVG
ncbi:hypothetical protein ES332_A10G281000v1 [Gossypium tomentosum]|uniref:Uncharacterized protein n=1 Tax=Gossypium tomentosum TaxID=34277 RepID=A0A5D2NXA0_GOSTO|nr:hypothetical protein ES332_A10G281000v1 [Gossypium tomentosum]